MLALVLLVDGLRSGRSTIKPLYGLVLAFEALYY
jgi:hypothetical protein